MQVGARLKELRLMLGLTQQQMCSGVVSKSFYSKIERDQSEIKVLDLLAILEIHEISLEDFFKSDKEKSQYQLLLQAFNNRSAEQVSSLIKSDSLNDHLKQEAEIMLAILTGTLNEISSQERQRIRRKYLKVGKIDPTQMNQLRFILPIISNAEASLLMAQVFEDYHEKTKNREYLLTLSNIYLDYLLRSYRDGQFKAVKETIRFIERLPMYSYLGLAKLIAQYYQFLLADNKDQLNKIIKLLKVSGFKQYSNSLPKLKEKEESNC